MPTRETTTIPAESFGETPDGRLATVYTLESPQLRVRVTDYGGRVVSIEAPDRSGDRTDVVLGFDDVAGYVRAGGAFGALLGRNANRIAGGRFTVDGQSYRLPTNDGSSTLHGGPVGFDKVFWSVTSAVARPLPALGLLYVSPDGDQGFPGELSVAATYRLDGESLWLLFEAHTTKPTPVSLSAHPYFNLAGARSGDVLGHVVTIASEAFLPTDERQIPTGEIRSVAGTPFDFREPTPLGARIRLADPQLIYGTGYDHCYVLGAGQAAAPLFAACALDPASGRTMEVYTTQPGMQLYTGNQLKGSVAGRGGVIYRQSAGLAFEPQGFPDAPHHPAFPSTILRPEDRYRAAIRYRFTS
ncbi:MAG TPA: aldose epimerase family protein [Steroidobacteraceae bacterium]|nr:aldose epimerase family protein [Steroidobacteraceae bacterium]